MKKNKAMRAASGLLVAILLTTSMISRTFAKYTSTESQTSTATVAKWSFKVGDTQIEDSQNFTFDLFNTANEFGENVEDTDVKKDGNIIAPGTQGKFELKLTNDSEVNATYAVDYTVDNKGVPIEYSIDGTTWTKNLTNVNATNIAINETATITVQWRWAFEGSGSTNYTTSQTDTTDTALGSATNLAQPSVIAKITATQVD